MANFYKDLKVTNISAGNIVTTDNNGKLVSANITTNNIATLDVTNTLANRITNLESSVENVGQRLQNING